MTKNLSTLLTTNQTVSWGGNRSETGLNFPAMLLVNNGPFIYSGLTYFGNAGPEDYCDATVSATEDPDTPGHGAHGPNHPQGPGHDGQGPDPDPRGHDRKPFARDPGGRGPRW